METYAKINLDNIKYNVLEVKKLLPLDCKIQAVLKANAYGHGAVEVFKALKEIGIERFAVATFFEAMELRKIDKNADIMLFAYISPKKMKEAVENNFTITVYSKEFWQELKKHVKADTKVHVKLNTGFNRVGFDFSRESLDIIKEISEQSYLEGVYSHLALKDEESDLEQYKKFNEFIESIEKMNINIPIKHLADSIASIRHPWSRLDMVRLGAVMYGTQSDRDKPMILKSSIEFNTHISQIRNIKKGDGISYDYSFVAEKDMTIATLPVGYEDGYPRTFSNKGYMLVKGQKARVLGIICMDQLVIDITDIKEVKTFDEVNIYSNDKDSEVFIGKIVPLAGTNRNELFTLLGRRVKKIYINNGISYEVI